MTRASKSDAEFLVTATDCEHWSVRLTCWIHDVAFNVVGKMLFCAYSRVALAKSRRVDGHETQLVTRVDAENAIGLLTWAFVGLD